MIDIVNHINATQREVVGQSRPDGEGSSVRLRRSYDAPVEDVWDACTDPDRIARWFLPVSGDLRLGGTYQLQGNAGGEILACEPPTLLRVSWVFGAVDEAHISEVELRLSPAPNGSTELALEHSRVDDPEKWPEYGPGAVGVGWDLTLLGLGLHLAGGSIPDRDAWPRSPEATEFMTRSSDAWRAAHEAAGATATEAATASAKTLAAYAPHAASDVR
jgi:uncharacterized protein YndB with AHSA1/START domain